MFENFCNAFVDEPGKKLSKEIKSVVSAMNHKPFQKESTAHKKFMNLQLKKIKAIKANFPFIDFSMEENFFSSQ